MTAEQAARIANRSVVRRPRVTEFKGKSIFGHAIVMAGPGHGDSTFGWGPSEEEAYEALDKTRQLAAEILEL